MNILRGTGVAIVTPFNTDGSVDHLGLRKLINYLIEEGIEYIVSMGTTGESATLCMDEKKAIFDTTRNEINGRIGLVAGIGGNDTRAVLTDLKEFDLQGFDAILSVCPYYNKPNQEGIYQHYSAIAEHSKIPVILYNVPGRSGIMMTSETTIRLANDHPNIVGMKEASGNFNVFNQIIRDKPEDFILISGDDPITLPMLAMGAVGVISVLGNALPGMFSTMVRMCLDGKFIEAQPLHYSMIELTRLLFTDGNPAGVKATLELLDICGHHVRLPLTTVSDETKNSIKYELSKLGINQK